VYNYIKGIVIDIQLNTIILECNGIGYEINSTLQCISKCEIGKTTTVYVYLAVKEDDMSLFGFVDIREKTMFLNLVSINGVGNKTAINILSNLSLQELAVSVVKQNVSAFSKIKGIGKKTAERILLELKDKVEKDDILNLTTSTNISGINSQLKEAQAALLSLGFKNTEVRTMLDNVSISDNMGAEDIIGLALRKR